MDNGPGTKEFIIPMKNSIFVIGIGIIVVLAAISLSIGSGKANPAGNVIAAGTNGQVQVIKLSVENARYILNPNEIKKGIPVRIEADISKMPGCSKSIVISAFNIRKVFTSSDNTLEFTPDKAGTFNIACSMNMYKGKFTVLESDGSKSNYVQVASQRTAGCSASGGGCGCGG